MIKYHQLLREINHSGLKAWENTKNKNENYKGIKMSCYLSKQIYDKKKTTAKLTKDE